MIRAEHDGGETLSLACDVKQIGLASLVSVYRY